MLAHTLMAFVSDWFAQPDQPPPTFDFDVAPQQPPGKLGEATATMIAWLKWGGLVASFVAVVAAGIMMSIGRRNRNNMAIEGAISLPWIVVGMGLILGAGSIIGFLL